MIMRRRCRRNKTETGAVGRTKKKTEAAFQLFQSFLMPAAGLEPARVLPPMGF